MKRMTRIGFTLMLTLFVAISGSAQKKQTKKSTQSKGTDLQTEMAQSKAKEEKLKKDIEAATKELEKNKQKKKKTLNEVVIMDEKINNRQDLINTYNEQLNLLNRKIQQGTESINNMNDELDRLTQEYARMVQFAYRYRNRYEQLEFLFAAKDFNQAMQRMRYIQQFADARKTKIEQITNIRQQVNEEIEANRKALEEQKALLEEQQAQQSILKKEKAELDAQYALLKKEESNIVAEINKKKAEQKKLENKIAELIRRDEEAKKAAEEAAKSGNKKTGTNKKTSDSNFVVFDESEKQTSTEFSKKRPNKLLWPVEQGRVSIQFGDYNHPTYSSIKMFNNGIDIQTTNNAKVRAVFAGVVAMVDQSAPANQTVLIRHGDYYTVYTGLDYVSVKVGNNVTEKQEIGRVHTNRDGESILHFELLKNHKHQNPEEWLTKKK